jgi:hypothetical protein
VLSLAVPRDRVDVAADYRFDPIDSQIVASTPARTLSLSALCRCLLNPAERPLRWRKQVARRLADASVAVARECVAFGVFAILQPRYRRM